MWLLVQHVPTKYRLYVVHDLARPMHFPKREKLIPATPLSKLKQIYWQENKILFQLTLDCLLPLPPPCHFRLSEAV